LFRERDKEEKIYPSSAICEANAKISAMYGTKNDSIEAYFRSATFFGTQPDPSLSCFVNWTT